MNTPDSRAAFGAPAHVDDERRLVHLAQRHYDLRRVRDEIFSSFDIFGEAAWDMLLSLFAAQLDDRKVTIGALCSVSGVSTNSAMRWIALLQDTGLIVRYADERDAATEYMRLTPYAHGLMANYLTRVASVRC